ncbi:MAG: DUF3737 family protein [Lachnospiraceae bacterium]|nr:DUF3737 family protein [Lachnospiraceae bacterium]
MKEIKPGTYEGERALYMLKDAVVKDSTFQNGESPLKESANIEIYGSLFKWKYPLWYCNNVLLKDSMIFEMGRAGIWYTNNLKVEDTVIKAPKNFRRCKDVSLKNVPLPNAQETFWNCDGIRMENVTAKGDYFAMGSKNIYADNFVLDGNYSFDGCENIEIHNSKLLTKDAFWNCENVTVYDSFISADYIGWNSKNVTFINCTIETLQGMCYLENLVMRNCKVLNTDHAFEFSTVDVELSTPIESVFNPISGTIKAPEIGNLIMEKEMIDPSKTKIECENILKKSDHPDWTN